MYKSLRSAITGIYSSPTSSQNIELIDQLRGGLDPHRLVNLLQLLLSTGFATLFKLIDIAKSLVLRAPSSQLPRRVIHLLYLRLDFCNNEGGGYFYIKKERLCAMFSSSLKQYLGP